MDYKELIEHYRSMADRWERGEQLLLTGELRLQDAMRDAADAIETLMAERDAAVKLRDAAINEIRGVCKFCKHSPPSYRKTTCYDCCEDNHNWLWRGFQEGEPHGE